MHVVVESESTKTMRTYKGVRRLKYNLDASIGSAFSCSTSCFTISSLPSNTAFSSAVTLPLIASALSSSKGVGSRAANNAAQEWVSSARELRDFNSARLTPKCLHIPVRNRHVESIDSETVEQMDVGATLIDKHLASN